MHRILVVDDTAETCSLLRRLFALRGHDAQCVNEGAGVVGVLRHGWFDLVVLDVMMPEVDGFDVLGRIRRDADPAVSGVRVVMYSALGDRHHVARARHMGADEWVVKGGPVGLLERRVDTLLCAGL
jgi:DNA-binding response OmpR family regulator